MVRVFILFLSCFFVFANSSYAEKNVQHENEIRLSVIETKLDEREKSLIHLDAQISYLNTKNNEIALLEEKYKATEQRISDFQFFVGAFLTIAALGVALFGINLRTIHKEFEQNLQEVKEKLTVATNELDKIITIRKEAKEQAKESEKKSPKTKEEAEENIFAFLESDLSNQLSVEEYKKTLTKLIEKYDPFSDNEAVDKKLTDSEKISPSDLEKEILDRRIQRMQNLTRKAEGYDIKLPASHYFNLAYDLDDAEEYKEAVKYYTKVIEIDPEDAIAFYNRGLLFQNELNEPEKALEDYTNTITLSPDYAFAYNNRGNLYKNKFDEPEKALKDFTKAMILKPDDLSSYLNKAELLITLLRFQNAINILQGKLLTLQDFSDRAIANYLLRLAYTGEGNETNEVEKQYAQLIDDNPNCILEDWGFTPVEKFLASPETAKKVTAERLERMKQIHEDFKKLAKPKA